MKLKCLKTGEILSVDHVVATDEHGNQWIYRDGIEAFADPNTNTCPHAETQIAELTKTVASMAKAMSALSESLAVAHGRLDELEPKSSLDPHDRIDTLRDAIGCNTRSIENLASGCNSILNRVIVLESENQRLKDRLNAIEGLGIPR